MKSLQDIRREIDSIDAEILALLQKRFLCSKEIARIKQETGMPVFDRTREEELFARIEAIAKKEGIPPSVAQSIFTEIVHQSRRVQEREKSL